MTKNKIDLEAKKKKGTDRLEINDSWIVAKKEAYLKKDHKNSHDNPKSLIN